jgi:hypothetical protein
MPPTVVIDTFDNVTIETETRNGGETAPVGTSQIQGPDTITLKGLNQRLCSLIITQLVGQKVLGPAWYYHHGLVTAFEAVCNFPGGSVSACSDNQRTLIVNGGFSGQFTGVFQGAGKTGTNLNPSVAQILFELSDRALAAACAGMRVYNISDITIIYIHCTTTLNNTEYPTIDRSLYHC